MDRHQLFRLAAKSRLIQDVDVWMQYHRGYNRTTHDYSVENAEEVYLLVVEFVHDALELHNVLEDQTN